MVNKILHLKTIIVNHSKVSIYRIKFNLICSKKKSLNYGLIASESFTENLNFADWISFEESNCSWQIVSCYSVRNETKCPIGPETGRGVHWPKIIRPLFFYRISRSNFLKIKSVFSKYRDDFTIWAITYIFWEYTIRKFRKKRNFWYPWNNKYCHLGRIGTHGANRDSCLSLVTACLVRRDTD